MSFMVDGQTLELLKDPALSIPKVRRSASLTDFLSESNTQFSNVLERFTGPLGDQLHNSEIILSVHTGLRRGNLFSLRWDCVDFLNRVVRIQRTKSGRPLQSR